MCLAPTKSAKLTNYIVFNYRCAAILEPCDGSVRIAARTITVDVMRVLDRVLVEIWRADNEEVVYLNGTINDLGELRHYNFSNSQIAGIRRRILAVA